MTLLPTADYYVKPMRRLPETRHYSDFCYYRHYYRPVRLQKRTYDCLKRMLSAKQKQKRMSGCPTLPYSENDYLARQKTRLYGLTKHYWQKFDYPMQYCSAE